MSLHYGLLWAVWATLQVYEDSNIDGGGGYRGYRATSGDEGENYWHYTLDERQTAKKQGRHYTTPAMGF